MKSKDAECFVTNLHNGHIFSSAVSPELVVEGHGEVKGVHQARDEFVVILRAPMPRPVDARAVQVDALIRELNKNILSLSQIRTLGNFDDLLQSLT
jgi:hypothetical protein